MALGISYSDTATMVTYPGAVVKIDPSTVKVDYASSSCSFAAQIFGNQSAAANSSAKPVGTIGYSLTGSDFITYVGNSIGIGLYSYLQSLPQYSGAIPIGSTSISSTGIVI